MDDAAYYTEIAGKLQDLADTYDGGSLWERASNWLFSRAAARYRRLAARAKGAGK